MIERFTGRAAEELKRDEQVLTDVLREAGAMVKGRSVRCPFHDDHRPSGGIYQTESGNFRYKCQGCGFNGSAIDVLAKVERIEPIEVFRRLRGKAEASSDKRQSSLKVHSTIEELKASMPGTVETVYQYMNPSTGKLDMIAIRIILENGKTFRLAKPVDGGFVLKAPEKPWPLYNRVRIAAADTVVIVEGEKKVEALHEYGITATTSPGGAKNAKSADWTPLAGKNCILWPDANEAGAKYMTDVGELLGNLEPITRIAYINPSELDLIEGEDCVDFIKQLRVVYEDPQQVQAEVMKALGKAKPRGFSAQVAEGIEAAIEGKRRIIKTPWSTLDHLSRALMPGTVCLLVGNPGGSKSFMMLQVLSHVMEQGIKTSVFELEENRQYHLYRALAQRSGIAGITDPEWIETNPGLAREIQRQHADFLDVMGRVIYCSDSNLTLSQLAEWIESRAKQGHKLIAIDPLSAAAHNVRESWEEDSLFIQRIKRIAVEYGICILIVHHPTKVVSSPDLSQIAGGAAFGRFVQCVLWLEAHEEKTGPVRTCCGTTDTTYNRTLHVIKARNAVGTGCRLAMNFDKTSLTFSEQGLIVKK